MLKIIKAINRAITACFAGVLLILLNSRSLIATVCLLAGAQLVMVINDPLINLWAYKISATSLTLIFFQLFLFGAGFLALSFAYTGNSTIIDALAIIVFRSIGFSVLCIVSLIAYLRLFWIESRIMMIFFVISMYAISTFYILIILNQYEEPIEIE